MKSNSSIFKNNQSLKTVLSLVQFISLCFFLSCGAVFSYAQPSEIDSLQKKLKYSSSQDSIKIYNRIGWSYYEQADYVLCHRNAETLIKLSKRANDLKNLGDGYYMKFAAFTKQNNIEDARKYVLKLKSFAQRHSKTLLLAKAHRGIGTLYKLEEQYDDAIREYRHAIKILGSEEAFGLIASVHNNLAVIYASTGEPRKALTEFQLALLQVKKLDQPYRVCLYLSNIGKTYLDLGKYKEAEENMLESLELAEKGNFQNMLLEINKNLYLLYKRIGRLEKAAASLEDAMKWQGKINMNAQSQITMRAENELRLKEKAFDLKLADERNKKLKHKKALQEVQIERQRLYIVISILAASILILIVYRLRKMYRMEKSGREKDQKHFSRKLSNSALHKMEKNKLLVQLDHQLERINDANELEEVEKIRKEIKKNVDLDDDWQKVLMHFDEIHPDFFSELVHRFPKLTPNDLKLCAFIKMNLNRKEIAALMNISPDSVKKNRQRMRKKLELDEKVTLTDFIKNL